MAPTLKGKHVVAHCPDCQIEFTADFEQAQEVSRLVCPNCGDQSTMTADCQVADADLVTIQLDKRVNRWDIIAFQGNGIPDEKDAPVFGIKRVIGLPGENIRIFRGDLFQLQEDGNWNVLCKPMTVQRELRIPIHDTLHPTAIARWKCDPQSSWHCPERGRWRVVGQTYDQERFHWLSHVPQDCFLGKTDLPSDGIKDNYGHNQSISRKLNPVADLAIVVDYRIDPASELALEFDYFGQVYQCQLDLFHRYVRLAQVADRSEANRFKAEGQFSDVTPIPRTGELEVSWFDQQLRILVNKKPLWEHSLEPGDGIPGRSPIRLGARGGDVYLDRIRVFRDIYYFADPHSGQQAQFDSERGYLLLGDNVPVSYDSRQWSPPGVLPGRILGIVAKELE